MRLLYLTPGCFSKGGISRYCRYQIAALRELLGADNVKVLSLRGPAADDFETEMIVHWHGSSFGVRDRAKFALHALRLAATWRPDVVLSAHVNFAPLLTTLRRAAGARSLLNVYGLELWSGLSARRRSAMRQVDEMIADCHFSADFVAAEDMFPRRPQVIWDCVDLERFKPGPSDETLLQRYGIPDKRREFVVMSLGRLSRGAMHKGYDRLIRNFSVVARRREGCSLVIAGDGDNRESLQQLACEVGVADRVVFTGSVAEDDLPGVYRAASLFSLVSDRGIGRGEGIPLTPLEAMASGVPVIVGNQDGSQEAVVDGRNGFVIDPFDGDAHCRCIEQTLDAPRYDELCREARAVAEECFGSGRFRDEHETILESLGEPPRPISSA